jgi:metallophosphoesterase (TIGR00282 family)
MNILLIGDVVGHGGRAAVCELVPRLREQLNIDFVIVNGENMAGGRGMNTKTLKSLDEAEVDLFTSGDHIWDQRQFLGEIDNWPNVLRPANLPVGQPGKGYGIFTAENGKKVGVVNLLGQVFVGTNADNPFQAAQKIIEELKSETDIILVDFHAEATSEKIAMGFFLDGKVSCVFGTHTHVQTNDAKVLENGTAYITDIGMVGSRNSVLGRKVSAVLKKFSTGIPSSFDVVNSAVTLTGAVVKVDDTTGKAVSIQTIVRDFS